MTQPRIGEGRVRSEVRGRTGRTTVTFAQAESAMADPQPDVDRDDEGHLLFPGFLLGAHRAER